MSEYRFLCPECGHAFPQGTAFTHCPECRVPLVEAAPNWTADLRNLPDHLDVDELMRQVLAEQQPEEDIDAVLQRVVQRGYPDAREGLYRLISQQLDACQRMRGVTREEAAEQLAKAQSELQMGPEGMPKVVTRYRPDLTLAGLEDLSPEQRQEVTRQIQEAIEAGKPIPEKITLTPAKSKAGCASVVLIAGVLAILGWAVYCG